MKAIILAGGFGTRLRPISCSRPKTLFPIINKPLLEGIFERLSENNITEAIMAVNSLTEFYIKKQKIKKYGLKIRYSIDPPKNPLGTAGPIKKAEKLIGKTDSFLVLNGDIFADVKYKEIIETHKEKKALATIVLKKVKDPSRYGSVEITKDNRIKQFIEKQKKGLAPTNLINAGIYVLNSKVLQYIEKNRPVSMEREIFPKLVEEKNLFGHCMQGLWIDIGNPAEYLEANKFLLEIYYKDKKNKKYKTKNYVAIDTGVKIGAKTIIGPYTVLGKKVSIGKLVQISKSVILPNSEIQDGTKICESIIGEGVFIGKNVRVGRGCIIGDFAKIRDNVSLPEGAKVCPGKEINENILKSNIVC